MADIGIGGDVGSVGVGADSSTDAQGRRAAHQKNTRQNGQKSTLAGPSTEDSLSTPDAPAQPPEPTDPVEKLARRLRRGRRASILASAGNANLGGGSVVRPGGRAAKVLLG